MNLENINMNIKVKSLFIFSLILCAITLIFYIFSKTTINHTSAKQVISNINYINQKIAETVVMEKDYINLSQNLSLSKSNLPNKVLGKMGDFKISVDEGENTYVITSVLTRSSCPFIINEMKKNSRLLKISLMPLNINSINRLLNEDVDKVLKTVYKNKKSLSDKGIVNICKQADYLNYTFTFSDFVNEVK